MSKEYIPTKADKLLSGKYLKEASEKLADIASKPIDNKSWHDLANVIQNLSSCMQLREFELEDIKKGISEEELRIKYKKDE